MVESAYDFAVILLIFPVLLILLIAGVFAAVMVGSILFVNGLKSKWRELNDVKRTLKIVSIVIGALLLTIALLISIYVTVGFIELSNRGGFLGHGNKSSSTQSNALICYLSLLL